MALPAVWIAIDVIGTQLIGDIFVHSAAGDRVVRPLRRCANKLGFDRAGETVFRELVGAALADAQMPSLDGVIVEIHRVDAVDGTRIGLLIWAAAIPPAPRPACNAWALDMSTMITRTIGEGPSIMGDGRLTGAALPIQTLLTGLNPEDAWSMLGIYYDALTGEDGLLLETCWSVRPKGTEWVHMWSTCRLRVTGADQRYLYGLTLRLASRDIHANIAEVVRYAKATLLLVEPRHQIPLTSVGRLAPLSDDRTAQVMAQVDLDRLGDPADPDGPEQAILIDGRPFTASIFALRAAQPRYGDPVGILLLSEHEAGIRTAADLTAQQLN